MRIEFIDLAKGFCILLVVFLHSRAYFRIPNFMALRMPLYFILGGLFFRDYGSLKFFTKKKIRNLIVPFLTFYIVPFLILFPIYNYLNPDEPLSFSIILEPLRYGTMHSSDIQNKPLWFLCALFWCNLLFAVVYKYAYLIKIIPSRWAIPIAVALLTIIGVILSYFRITLPLYLSSSLLAMPFFYGGVLLGNTKFLYPNKYDKYSLLFAALFILIAYALYYSFDKHSHPIIFFWRATWSGYLLLAYLNSFLMVTGVLLICKTIVWLPVISYIGRHSIILLLTHFMILMCIGGVVEKLIGVALTPWETFLYTLLLCWLLIPLMKRYIPSLCAQPSMPKSVSNKP